MRAVLVILLIAGIAALALGLGLISGEWEANADAGYQALHGDSVYASTQACLTCHRNESLSWSAPGIVPVVQSTVREPASVLRGSATLDAQSTHDAESE